MIGRIAGNRKAGQGLKLVDVATSLLGRGFATVAARAAMNHAFVS